MKAEPDPQPWLVESTTYSIKVNLNKRYTDLRFIYK